MLNRPWFFSAMMVALSLPLSAHAETKHGVAQAAPTQPVTSNNLDAPVFQSDTRNLEAILDKDKDEGAPREPARVAKPASVEVPARPAPPAAPAAVISEAAKTKIEKTDDSGFSLFEILTSIRVFAIRWRDVIDIILSTVMVVLIRKMYVLNREQYKFMAHCVRAAENAAAAAKRSADVAESLLKHQQMSDEAQGKLDLR